MRQNPFPGLRPFMFHEHELFFGREEQYEQMIGKLSETRFLAVVGTSGSGKSSLVRAGLLPALYGGMMMSAGPSWRVAVFRPKDDPIREMAQALNHRRVFGDRSKENGSSLFKLSEFIDWPGLCTRLSDEAQKLGGNPSRRILEVLPAEKRQVIAEVAGNGDVEDKSEVVQTFNDILKLRGFYRASDFEKGLLTAEASTLLTRGQNNLTEEETEKLNRLLLEASYPLEIAKKVEIHTQITEVMLRRGNLGLIDAAREAHMLPEENLLIVVDQFEELFRYARISEHGPHGNHAAAFVKLLLEAKSQSEIPIYVVLTMRSDYLGDCAKFWELPEAINEAQYLIPRLTRDQLREAIKGPIELQGAKITPQLVNHLVNDMGDDPDQLPILQHALMRTWEAWEREHPDQGPIDVRHYAAIGRMAEALSIHADEAYAELPDERSRQIAEQIFKCLTEKEVGDRETRRPTNVKDIRGVTTAKFKEIVSVLNVFRQEGRSFLMPAIRKPLKRSTSVDISHESLIRNWTKLKKWVDAEAESANVYRRLVESARLHERRLAGLYSDLEVEYALKWKETNKPNLAWAARYHSKLDNIDASHSATADKETQDASDRRIFEGAMAFLEKSRKASHQKTRIRRVSAALLGVAAVLTVAFLWVIGQWMTTARENRLKAGLAYGAEMNLAQRELEAKNFAEVNRLLQDSNTPPEQSGFLSRFEWYRWLSSPTDLLKQDASLRGFEWYYLWRLSHDESRTVGEYDSRVLSLALPQHSNLLFTATGRGTIELRDLDKGVQATFGGSSNDITALAFAPAGNRVVIGTRDGSIKLGEMSNDRQAPIQWRDLAIPKDVRLPSVGSVAFSPNGQLLAVGTRQGVGARGAVRVWQTSDLKELPEIRMDLSDSITAVAFSPSSQSLAIVQKAIVTLVGVKTQQPLLRVDSAAAMLPYPGAASGQPPILCLAISPDESLIAMGKSDNNILIWDLKEDRYLTSLVGHSMEVLAVVFSDRELASGSRDGSIRLWNVGMLSSPLYRQKVSSQNQGIEETYKLLLTENKRPFSRANLTPDNLAKPSDIRGQAEREISTELFVRALNGHSGAVTSLVFKTNDQLVSGSDDKTVKYWDVPRPQPPLPSFKLAPSTGGGVYSLAFSPNGEMLVAGNYDGSALLWNTTRNLSEGSPGERILERGPKATVSSVAFAPNSQILAAASWDNTVRLWEMSNPSKRLDPLIGHSGSVLAMVFADDETVITGSADKTVRMWNVKTKSSSVVMKLDKGDAVLCLAYSPQRKLLAIGTTESTVILWDLNRGKQVTKLEGHSDDVSAIAFSPDGSIVATGSGDAMAKLWKSRTGEELVTFQGHSKRISSLTFSPDGRRLATGSEDGSVKLWDTMYEAGNKSTRHALVTDVLNGPAFAIAFSPDGATFARGILDGSVLIRRSASPDMVARQSRPVR